MQKFLASLTIMLGIGVSATSQLIAAPLHEACDADIAKYCGQITPGNGRILACIYAHEEFISDSCDEATSDMTDVIDAVLGTVGDAIAICLPDIKEHCSDTKFGGGRILSCLMDNKSNLNDDCNAVVSEIVDHLVED
jgi:hypothetical protein